MTKYINLLDLAAREAAKKEMKEAKAKAKVSKRETRGLIDLRTGERPVAVAPFDR